MLNKILTVAAAAALLTACDKGTQSTTPKVEPIEKNTNATPATPAATNAPAAESQGDPDMKTTESGLKYKVLQQGTGTESPTANSTVKVHYHGTLLNGKVFDSSVKRGQPISFPLNAVIPGWTEGLQLMKVGDKFKFEIPPALAYGADSPSPLIPPNSTLVFEVELLEIK